MKKLLFLFLLIFVGVSVGSCQNNEKAKKYRLIFVNDDWKTNPEKYLENKQYVKTIYLDETDSIPIWIDEFNKLKILVSYGNNNGIKYFPKKIKKCTELQKLIFMDDNISIIPDFIGDLSKLDTIFTKC